MAALNLRSSSRTVVEIGRRRLRAVVVSSSGRSRQIVRAMDVPLPLPAPASESTAGIPSDSDAFAAWLAKALDDAGIPRGPVLLALPRDGVVVKLATLPGAEPHELPDMARLAIQSDLPIESGDAAIDFVPLAAREGVARILGVASSQRALRGQCERLVAAGRPPSQVTLRALGSVALATTVASAGARDSTSAATGSQPTLIVDVTGEGVELVVIASGEILFSRGIELREPASISSSESADAPDHVPDHAPDPAPDPATTALVAEVRRSWLGYRMGKDAAQVERALLFASRSTAEQLAAPLAAALSLPVECVVSHPRVNSARGGHAVDAGSALPLVGLALEECSALDLIHPRRSPDRAARRRQLVLAAVGLLVIASLVGFTLGKREARRTAELREEIATKARAALPEGWRLRRDADKLRHVEQWSVPSQAWISDLVYVKNLLPQPGDVVLDSVAASQEFSGVKWDKAKAVNDGWSSASEVRIVLEGEAKTRAIADALRETLIADDRFSVTTSGSDTRGGNRLQYPFGYLLRTQLADPAQPVGKSKARSGGSSPAPPNERSAPVANPGPNPRPDTGTESGAGSGVGGEGGER